MPASLDAERTILGAVLLDNRAYSEASARLTPADFYLTAHQRVFSRMGDLIHSGHIVDIVTLSEELHRRKEIESVGGVAWLASLTEGLPRRLSITEYVAIVRDKALQRRIINVCSNAISRAADQSEGAESIIASTRAEVEAISAESIEAGLQRAGDFLSAEFKSAEAMMDRPAKQRGVLTGIDEFDEMTCGLQPGDLVIVGARPSMGKTSWGLNIAERASVDGTKITAFFSLEMTKQSLLDRMVCSRGHVDLKTFRAGRMSYEDRRYFADAMEDIQSAKGLYIDDKKRPTVTYLRNQAAHLKAKVGLDLIVADHLGLFSAADQPRNYNREQQVGMMSQMLKAVAADLGVPLLLLCQLSRANTQRTDKRPMLSDLRESGSIEQDADVVAFLHRESYYTHDDESLKDKGEIILAKQRQGPTGTVQVAYQAHICRWGDLQTLQEQTAFHTEGLPWGQ